eukprot:257193-Hanusia_phi.AAC.1
MGPGPAGPGAAATRHGSTARFTLKFLGVEYLVRDPRLSGRAAVFLYRIVHLASTWPSDSMGVITESTCGSVQRLVLGA